MSDFNAPVADGDGYRPIGTLVLGAGLVGMATAAAYAEQNAASGAATLVVEKGAAASYRDATPSQGNLRGSRVVDQPPELTHAIRRTWDFMERLEMSQNMKIMTKSEKPGSPPYLMAVKDRDVLNGIRYDLSEKKSVFDEYATTEASDRFGLRFPEGYAGVINARESKTLDIGAYMDAMKRDVEKHHGAVAYETTIVDYGKTVEGKHRVTLSNGEKYCADALVVATGGAIGETLRDLRNMHDISYVAESDRFENPCAIPSRFQPGNSVMVPQRTIHVLLPGFQRADPADPRAACKPTPRPMTVYNLDITREIPVGDGQEKHPGGLGFYMFPDLLDDGTGKKVMGLKVGYDPMGCTEENPESFARQESLMLDHVAKTYHVDVDAIRVVDRHSCAYPVDVAHYPCMGVSAFHGVTVAANFIGYGAMAAYGAAQCMLAGEIRPSSLYNPDYKPTERDKAVFANSYGPDRDFAPPECVKEVYTKGSKDRGR